MTRFGAALARLRGAQGFSSAYAFYNSRGGRKAFGLAFANYLKMEKGRTLPKGQRLTSLLSCLGLEPRSSGARELVFAYLADTLGSEDLLIALKAAPPSDPAPSSWLLAESAGRQAISQRALQLTFDQYEALASDRGAYACHVLLANTRGGLSKKDLAEKTRLNPAQVEAALGKLRKAGLAKTTRTGAESPLAGRYVVPPVATPALAGIYACLQEYRRDWVKNHGSPVDTRYLVLRAPRSKFSQYLPHLADVVALSAVYGDVVPASDSEMYLVEGRVTRIFGRP
jgi:transcriptional regulator with XRE-family HTH domain